jgi:transcription elongation factor GreA
MVSTNIPMTQTAYDKVAEDLDHLKKHERPAIIAEIAEARAQGDLSENAEYHAAKEKQGHIEDRIQELEDKLARAEIVTASAADADHIIFGAQVEVKNLANSKIISYILVGSDEVDPLTGKISSASPIGKGVLGKKIGDVVEVDIPKGKLRLEILKFG